MLYYQLTLKKYLNYWVFLLPSCPHVYSWTVLSKWNHLCGTCISNLLEAMLESNQGNQGYSGNQKNVIKGQRPHMENRHTPQRTWSN